MMTSGSTLDICQVEPSAETSFQRVTIRKYGFHRILWRTLKTLTTGLPLLNLGALDEKEEKIKLKRKI